jgi:hypothetical protein
MSGTAVRVLLVDDQSLFREALATVRKRFWWSNPVGSGTRGHWSLAGELLSGWLARQPPAIRARSRAPVRLFLSASVIVDGAAVGHGVENRLWRAGAQGGVGARAERVVDGRQRDAQRHERGDREDLGVAESGVA